MAKKPTDDTEFGSEIEAGEDAVLASSEQIQIELTEKEKIALEKEARQEVAAAIKAAKMKDFKLAAKKRIQSEAMFRHGKDDTGEDLISIDLQLASYPKHIILDGVIYTSGRRYTKKRSVIAVLNEIMHRGWQQEAARLGERTDWAEQKQKVLSRNGLQMH